MSHPAMLVDNNHLFQPSYFAVSSSSAPSTSSSNNQIPDFSGDINDFFDTELFSNSFAMGNSAGQSSTSRGSSPQSILTPPQDPLPTSFPDVHDEDSGGNNSSNFYSLFDDDLKTMDMSLPSSSGDFMGLGTMDTSYGAGVSGFDMSMAMNMGGFGMGMDLSSLGGVGMGLMDQDPMQGRGIDPQLVDTPSAVSDHGEDESDDKESPRSPPDVPAQQLPPVVVEPTTASTKEAGKPMITIAPVKVGGHGKARKGTVQSGGVVKKTSTATKEKENVTSTYSAPAKKNSAQAKALTSIPTITSTLASASAYKASTPGPFLSGGSSTRADSEAGGDDDDDDSLPQDWRPSPEVFAKMTSKEKRQLRNKISARNFRVRRKEYIATLEGDIAERDRMLDHFRTQLGSRESENFALRQEIAALKKALLDGRGGPINLPPPAPLPEHSAAEVLLSSASSSTSYTPSSQLLTPNTQKDLPSSPRLGANAANRFWGGVAAGGVGLGGGYTPVHTALLPDVGSVLRRGLLQENMNPALNGASGNANGLSGVGSDKIRGGLGGFDGFADLNPFTMKTLDAYRMHLWGKMAQQHAANNNSNNNNTAGYSPSSSATSSPSPPSTHSQLPMGLAGNLRPHFFTPSSKGNLPSSSSPSSSSSSSLGYGSTLSALLSGKQGSAAAGSYPSPPASPLLGPKGSSSSSYSSSRDKEMQQRQQQQQHAMLAAMASQTILGKLGAAFWDAFTGHSGHGAGAGSASALASAHGAHRGDWDTDKVQRVLSGKAVLRVVDVEPPTVVVGGPSSSVSSASMIKEVPSVKQVSVAAKEMAVPVLKTEATRPAPSCTECFTEILEESMRSLTLGKK
ncbi:hypothetical protein CPB84DRAFT_367539 [Gymnopilus junonius]|uniref:BZIP domain-containing protein n=1 Tax=Gymnopilus junonius TaxID=109634 RepID=A0A9P5TR85_GYMJU|nr:hypothetical protein CPB84DRAFT_367539 [Gymnopilus junonius]